MSLEVETVLVPVDGSEASAHAAEYAAAIADRYGADIHALFVIGETVARGIETGEVDESAVAEDHQAFVADVEALAPEGVAVTTSTANAFSTTRKLHHPGSVTLDAAADVDADFIVVPRSTDLDGSGNVLEKAAEYVLLYASQPVLSV
ncbi:universal stress protein [Halospeciosus flavus]|uniref:Universal stress protein n=1 Tax=Halospeciosus flavus TaxID=3032283 RepID=A0ABD5Z6V2_9EURY|nr:universal stress protein [Halospeciosus flavus]